MAFLFVFTSSSCAFWIFSPDVTSDCKPQYLYFLNSFRTGSWMHSDRRRGPCSFMLQLWALGTLSLLLVFSMTRLAWYSIHFSGVTFSVIVIFFLFHLVLLLFLAFICVSWKNMCSTIFCIFSPFFFFLLLIDFMITPFMTNVPWNRPFLVSKPSLHWMF